MKKKILLFTTIPSQVFVARASITLEIPTLSLISIRFENPKNNN